MYASFTYMSHNDDVHVHVNVNMTVLSTRYIKYINIRLSIFYPYTHVYSIHARRAGLSHVNVNYVKACVMVRFLAPTPYVNYGRSLKPPELA